MNKEDVITFFDRIAPSWDNEQVRNETVIDFILEKGGIKENSNILDVACGTGVLFPDYISRGASVTGIDISSEMVKIAREKFPHINVLCGDAETCQFDGKFDAVMIYNAFPHFDNPEELIKNLCSCMKAGGRFSVAHGISAAELERCHSGAASAISRKLPECDELAAMMAPFFEVDVMISDERMYMVSGIRKTF